MTYEMPVEFKQFWSADDLICLAGKNQIATECLDYLLRIGIPPSQLCVIANREDAGKNSWQPSLLFEAGRRGVRVAALESLYAEKNLWFFSAEYDRLIKPALFASRRLYNIHFSLLPAYRGVCTSVWPILRNERETGVTFHEIDAGIDTGPVLLQQSFEIEADWTARDLYFAYQNNGVALFKEAMLGMGAGKLKPTPQDESKASLFRRKDIDFSDIKIDLHSRASQIHNRLRAHTFWEYQLPKIDGREVWSSRVMTGGPSGPRGSIRHKDEWRAVISGEDGDVEIRFSPYSDLQAWARGAAGVRRPEWGAVPDLNLMDARGWSVLMVAAYNGNVDACRSLVDAGASVEAANLRGTTPLMYAFSRMIQTGDSAAFIYLLSVGADHARRDAKGLGISDYLPPEKRGDLSRLFPSVFS